MRKSTLWLTDATPGQYYSYLIRIWRPGPAADWRIRVEAIASGERYTFTELEDLFTFLRMQVRSPPTDGQARLFDQ